jgi:type I restriction enzyme R subunit
MFFANARRQSSPARVSQNAETSFCHLVRFALKGHGFSRAAKSSLFTPERAPAREGGATLADPQRLGYPPDFFDFILIDECHRGGANELTNAIAAELMMKATGGIMEYFAPAVQLGLTATPRRKENADTYRYFGEPLFVYSLREGINDGFLTPFRVKQIATTLDDYVYTPDDFVVDGNVEAGRRYTERDFNRIIEIQASYCQRVTANDGEQGNQYLRDFQDNERTIPTILTTSQKLSTGVDARNVRNIVLMRPINTMIEWSWHSYLRRKRLFHDL